MDIKVKIRTDVFKATVLIFLLICGCQDRVINYVASDDWDAAGGNDGQTKYSDLTQINVSNVANLQEAWIFNSGNMGGNVQLNPLIIDGIVYVTTPSQELIALGGESGREIWRFDPSRTGESFGGINRGIAYWKAGADKRIFYTSGGYLNAIDLNTGQAVDSFGDQGRINLNEGLFKPASRMGITAPAAPVIYGDLVIVGAMTWSAPANVSAFNVHSGERIWTFNTIPHPEEFGYDTWGDPEFWKNGAGVNVWGGMSVDAENGLLFFATGQPKDDFYRPNNQGEQLYGNSIVALDAKTGHRRWHYQTLYHDLWDLDLPCAPILTTLVDQGKKIPGVVQLSKTGNIFMFNRLTGKLLSDVEERAVPDSPLYGENAFPTQPFVKWPESFSRQVVTEDGLTNISTEANEYAKARFQSADAGWFIPPSERGIIYYGIHGGAEWGGGSYNPNSNILFVNSNELAWHIIMRNINSPETNRKTPSQHAGQTFYLARGCISCHGSNLEGIGGIPPLKKIGEKYTQQEVVDIIKAGKGAMPAFSHIPEDEVRQIAAYLLDMQSYAGKHKMEPEKEDYYRVIDYTKFLDHEGYPATAPPWGTLNAINLTTGKIKWKVPLGEHPELTARGIPITGTENFGGSIATAGGLVFVAATRDQKFRAFDQETGKILWEAPLPFGGNAVPSTYMANGKQFVIIPATGGGKLGTKNGDAYVAFALPED